MDVVFLVKILVAIVLFVLYIIFAYMSRSLPALKLIGINIGMLLVFLVLGFVGFLGVDIGMNSAKIVGTVHQSRQLSKEELIYYGKIKNTGSYTINRAYVTAKLVDNVSGSKKSTIRGEGGSDEGSKEHKCTALKKLRKGETRKFTCRMSFPPGYVRSEISYKLTWD